MCIRDSFQRILADGTEALLVDRLQELLFQVGVAQPAGVVAVSYTHLRAHETVLDLVCRLLLEKKKKPDDNTNDRWTLQKLRSTWRA